MFRIGENHQYPGRVKMAMHNKFGHVPVLRGTDKDHKDGFDPGVGPPLRPIVAADEAPKISPSNLTRPRGQCTVSPGSSYQVVFSDIIITIIIIIIIICLSAAVVPPMEGTKDSVHFG